MATMMKPPQRELRHYISEISEHAQVRVGSPLPLGTLERAGGVNFAIFSRHASRVRLELFDRPEDAVPDRTQFRRFMFAQSRPYPKMIEPVAQLKVRGRVGAD
jgi:pullulanase/glycogen debranching enzyme